jgi:predicted nucleic acid-binding protein
MREVVSNTSPLLYLHQLGSIDLLPRLYSQILVPASVVEELAAGRAAGHDVPDVAALPWARIVSSPTLALLALATDLGKGEAEAIAIAHERNALLILDDGLARRHAKVVGVTLTGTLGVLVKAKTAGHIPRVATLISRLTELGFRLSDRTRDEILKLANEG